MNSQYLGVSLWDIKYPEKRKNAPIMPAVEDIPEMKLGTRALKHATKEFAIETTIQATERNKEIHQYRVSIQLASKRGL